MAWGPLPAEAGAPCGNLSSPLAVLSLRGCFSKAAPGLFWSGNLIPRRVYFSTLENSQCRTRSPLRPACRRPFGVRLPAAPAWDSSPRRGEVRAPEGAAPASPTAARPARPRPGGEPSRPWGLPCSLSPTASPHRTRDSPRRPRSHDHTQTPTCRHTDTVTHAPQTQPGRMQTRLTPPAHTHLVYHGTAHTRPPLPRGYTPHPHLHGNAHTPDTQLRLPQAMQNCHARTRMHARTHAHARTPLS